MDLLAQFPPNSASLTPIGFLERAATVYGDSPSIVYNNISYTWEETYQRCLQTASSISSMGIKRGQVVSVLAPNIPAMNELHFSVPMAGAILNNLNTRLHHDTLSHILGHSESELIFVDQLHHPLLNKALARFPPKTRPRVILIKDKDAAADLHDESIPAVEDYDQLVDGGNSSFEWVRPKSEWDPIALNYTSGTTNLPKGVLHSHRGYFIQTLDTLQNWSVPNEPVYLWTLPMFHVNGWSLAWGMAAVGATNVCMRRVDAPTIYAAIQKHQVTHMSCAPVVLTMLANMPNAKPLEKPVHVITAGSPPPASVLQQVESLGFVVSHGYGLTETSAIVVHSTWRSKWDRLPSKDRARLKARQGVGSLGMTEVDVLDLKTDQPVKRDGLTLGEVVLRGGTLMLGYLKDPEATSKATTRTGWFRTGDLGVIHSDGYLEIKDRLKDIIMSGGENISSVEVEEVLYTHPAVNEAAVVAQPDELWGESPCAFISLKKEWVGGTEKEIIEFCRDRMAHYMVPKTVVILDELLKTSTGKIQKTLLKKIAKDMEKPEEGNEFP